MSNIVFAIGVTILVFSLDNPEPHQIDMLSKMLVGLLVAGIIADAFSLPNKKDYD